VVADDCAETWISSINPTITKSERLKVISFANVGLQCCDAKWDGRD